MYLLLENFKLKSRVTKRDPSRSHFPDQFHAPTPLNARFLIEYKMTYIQFCICIYIYFMCPTCFQYANMMITIIQGNGWCFQKAARVTFRNSMLWLFLVFSPGWPASWQFLPSYYTLRCCTKADFMLIMDRVDTDITTFSYLAFSSITSAFILWIEI